MSLVHAAEFIAPEPGALGGGHAEHAILVVLFGQRRVAIEVLERPGTGHCANGAGANRKRRSNSPCREEEALGWELYARGAGRGGDGRGRPGGFGRIGVVVGNGKLYIYDLQERTKSEISNIGVFILGTHTV